MQLFNAFYAQLAQNKLSHWLETLPAQLKQWQQEALHGDFKQWQKVLANLPPSNTEHINIANGR